MLSAKTTTKRRTFLLVVRGCATCPFVGGLTGDTNEAWCGAYRTRRPSRRIPESVDVDTGAPGWCPIRKRDALVRLPA